MRITFIILLLCIAVVGHAQTSIRSTNLSVSSNRTTNLIFPAAISTVDRGSERIIVQKSTGNILRVKADTAFSDTTNLTVITSDGKLYSFLVSYAVSPEVLNMNLGTTTMVNQDTALVTLAEKILHLKNNLHGIRFSSGSVRFSLIGVYSNGEVIACKLRMENTSSLSFETGRMRCFTAGANDTRRRPSQVVEITPLLLYPASIIIKERQAAVLVLLLPKAALGDGQELQIDLSENNAERHLSLAVPNRHLLRSKLIQ